MNGLPPPRIARARGAARVCTIALLAAATAGCGVTGGRVDPGYPTSRPRVVAAAAIQPRLSGSAVRIPVPAGWGVARLASERGLPRSLVRLDGACYLSVSITGSGEPRLTAAQIPALYARPVAGYPWIVSRTDGTVLARLGQRSATSAQLARSSLGTAYLPMSPRSWLAIDFGAGVWPLAGHACSDADVAARLGALASAVATIFASARVVAPDVEPIVPAVTSASASAAVARSTR